MYNSQLLDNMENREKNCTRCHHKEDQKTTKKMVNMKTLDSYSINCRPYYSSLMLLSRLQVY